MQNCLFFLLSLQVIGIYSSVYVDPLKKQAAPFNYNFNVNYDAKNQYPRHNYVSQPAQKNAIVNYDLVLKEHQDAYAKALNDHQQAVFRAQNTNRQKSYYPETINQNNFRTYSVIPEEPVVDRATALRNHHEALKKHAGYVKAHTYVTPVNNQVDVNPVQTYSVPVQTFNQAPIDRFTAFQQHQQALDNHANVVKQRTYYIPTETQYNAIPSQAITYSTHHGKVDHATGLQRHQAAIDKHNLQRNHYYSYPVEPKYTGPLAGGDIFWALRTQNVNPLWNAHNV